MNEKLAKIQKILDAAEGNLASARNMLRDVLGKDGEPLDLGAKLDEMEAKAEENIIEGVFSGTDMAGADGKMYPVPPNYASKSKLVEGDGLKLTIAEDGSYIYKQIKPVERRNVVGTLSLDGSTYSVLAEGREYKILTASITFYKAEPGDQVTVTIPAEHDAEWAALENVNSKAPVAGSQPEASSSDPSDNDIEIIPAVPEETDAVDEAEPTKEGSLGGEKVVEPDTGVEDAEASTNAGNDDADKGKILEMDAAINNSTHDDQKPSDSGELPADNTPSIEYPNSTNTSISDEELLKNLKENLQSIETPNNPAPPLGNTPKPVDSLRPSTAPEPASTGGDTPIKELEI